MMPGKVEHLDEIKDLNIFRDPTKGLISKMRKTIKSWDMWESRRGSVVNCSADYIFG